MSISKFLNTDIADIDKILNTNIEDIQKLLNVNIIGGIDADTKLMLHCDGSDESTTFTDSSLSPHTMTANGNAKVDTDIVEPWGTNNGIASFDGTNSFISTSDSSDWDFSTDDFAIDFWMRVPSLISSGDNDVMIGHFAGSVQASHTGGWWIELYNNPGIPAYQIRLRVGQAVFPNFYDGSGSLSSFAINTWYHIEVSRTSGILYLFQDGVSMASISASWNMTNNQTVPLYIGCLFNIPNSAHFTGVLDEIRINKNIGGHVSNFTPPNTPYTT